MIAVAPVNSALGTVQVNQVGDEATVQFTPTPNAPSDQRFIGWQLAPTGAVQAQATVPLATWANPFTFTVQSNTTVTAVFAAPPPFGDVTPGDPAYEAIRQLAARGYILGYSSTTYGPDDGVQRAQMAALIARATPLGHGIPTNGTLTPPACVAAGSWDCEDWGTAFTDQQGLIASLWRNAGALQHYGVALGYADADCTARGLTFPCFGPTDPVTYAQTISFITRAMKVKGYWVNQGDPNAFLAVPAPHRQDVATFQYYTGGIPAAPTSEAGWNAQATRGWFARALWQALSAYWGTDGTLPDGRPAGGFVP